MTRWKDIYGPVPEGFEQKIQSTLEELADSHMTETDARSRKSRTTARKTGRTLLLAAAFAALLTVTALAAGVIHSDFFQGFFGAGAAAQTTPAAMPTDPPAESDENAISLGPGPGAPEDMPEQTPSVHINADGSITVDPFTYIYADGSSITVPGYELPSLDLEAAELLLGPYVREMDDAYTLLGSDGREYTVAFQGYIQDAAGHARLYFSVECPDGIGDAIPLMEHNSLNAMVLGPEWLPYFSICVDDGYWAFVDAGRSSDTVMYFSAPCLSPSPETGLTVELRDEAGLQSFTVTADSIAPAVTAESKDWSLAVSPMGARVEARIATDAFHDPGTFIIRFADGSDYVVYDFGRPESTGADNTYSVSLSSRDDGSSQEETIAFFAFNRLIDPGEIVSVSYADSALSDTQTIFFTD